MQRVRSDEVGTERWRSEAIICRRTQLEPGTREKHGRALLLVDRVSGRATSEQDRVGERVRLRDSSGDRAGTNLPCCQIDRKTAQLGRGVEPPGRRAKPYEVVDDAGSRIRRRAE